MSIKYIYIQSCERNFNQIHNVVITWKGITSSELIRAGKQTSKINKGHLGGRPLSWRLSLSTSEDLLLDSSRLII